VSAVQEFTETFRTEHRQVRDLLLDLVRAFGARDVGEARSLLTEVAKATGPHFRYEEEAMYPQLTGVFGDAYVGKLYADHDGAIRDARALRSLVDYDELTPELAALGIELTRRILPHVSDCDGLAIMVETLPGDVVLDILRARQTAQEAGLDLLDWAAGTRERSA
jgi:hypothetical protein